MKSSRMVIALAATCALVGVAVVAPAPRPRLDPARPEAQVEAEPADGAWRRRPVEVEEPNAAGERDADR